MTELPDLAKLGAGLASISQTLAPPAPREFRVLDFPPNPLVTNLKDNLASEFHRRLSSWIEEFDRALDARHEVGVRLVSFGQTVVFRLEDIGYWNPSLILFRGRTEDGQPVELIQHVSQISVLLTRLPRENPNEPKRPIGFHASTGDA